MVDNWIEEFRQPQCDPRIISEIQRSPKMSQEQGPNFMASWGGPQSYKQLANMPEDERLTFVAYLKGFEGAQEISEVTGIKLGDVNRNLRALDRKGFVKNAKELVYEPEEPIITTEGL